MTTAEKRKIENNIILPEKSYNTYHDIQKVVKVGPNTSIVEGDYVQIRVKNFLVRKTNTIKEDLVKEYHEVSLPITQFGGDEYMLFTDRDVEFYWKGEDNE